MKCSILDKDLFETEMCEKQNKTYFKLVSRLGDSVAYFDQLLGVRSTQKLVKIHNKIVMLSLQQKLKVKLCNG